MMRLSQAIIEYQDDKLLEYLQDKIENEEIHGEVMQMCGFQEGILYTPLQLAFKLNKSMEVILKLIDIGGTDMVMIDESRSALHWTCMDSNISNYNAISKLLEIGGKELVLIKDREGETALHWALRNKNLSIDVISKLLEVGGKELVLVDNKKGETALHCACQNRNILVATVSKLLEVGGKELVMMLCEYNKTALQYACENNSISADITSRLLEIGGKELLMMKSRIHSTALHYACKNENIPIGIISQLLELGGKELVIVKTRSHTTALHCACMKENRSIDVISKLLRVGGKELLLVKKNKRYDILLFHCFFFNRFSSSRNNIFDDAFAFILKECILANIGGEFGIGGLFNYARQEIQDRIYEKWQQLSPVLYSLMMSSLERQRPPLLHAAILAKAPLHVIQDIINKFDNTLSQVDSFNRTPIEVASDECLSWTEGLQDILEATASLSQHKGCSRIYTAAKYGLKWDNHMKELTQERSESMVTVHDSATGLRLFMVAAMGSRNDLSSIYAMMKTSPDQRLEFDGEECKHQGKKIRLKF